MDKKENQPAVEVRMLIRKPVAEVFNALVDPGITTNFWFTRSSGKLEAGKPVTWHWDMYGVSADVNVREVTPNKKISIEWNEPATTVDFLFTAVKEDATYVIIKNYGFHQSGDELVYAIRDNTGGFTTLLDGMKAYLEHGLRLNLVGDKYPKELGEHGQ